MRILHVLRSMASREATRIDLGLARGIYLVVAFAMFLPALMMEMKLQRTGMAAGSPGLMTIWAVWLPSAFLLVVLAGRLGGDAVGDFGSGLLDLTFMTGLKPWQWLVIRVVQVWSGFFSVWLVRLPILVCLFAFGGVRQERIFVIELLLLLAFLFVSGLALIGSFKTKSRQQVWSRIMTPIVFGEMLLHLPRIVVGSIAVRFGWTVPPTLTEWMDDMAATSLSSRMWEAIMGPVELAECVPTFLLYGVLAVLILLRFWFRLRAASRGLVDVPAVDRSQKAEYREGPRRVSRRCWDNALAWQAYCVHGYGKRLVQLKCAIYGVVVAVLLMSIPLGTDYTGPAFAIAALFCLISMLIAVGKPSDCLSREIRDETMPTLMLTPNSTDDFYTGWHRGSLHLVWPDVGLVIVLTLVGFSLNQHVASITLSVGLALLFGGPFMMLSPLVPVTFKGITTGLGLTFVILLIAGVCIAVGGFTHPIFVPLVLVPSAILFNWFVRRHVLPYWMERKISSIV